MVSCHLMARGTVKCTLCGACGITEIKEDMFATVAAESAFEAAQERARRSIEY